MLAGMGGARSSPVEDLDLAAGRRVLVNVKNRDRRRIVRLAFRKTQPTRADRRADRRKSGINGHGSETSQSSGCAAPPPGFERLDGGRGVSYRCSSVRCFSAAKA